MDKLFYWRQPSLSHLSLVNGICHEPKNNPVELCNLSGYFQMDLNAVLCAQVFATAKLKYFAKTPD
jgi:hypothetical protein